jgi:hypothetical protein
MGLSYYSLLSDVTPKGEAKGRMKSKNRTVTWNPLFLNKLRDFFYFLKENSSPTELQIT